MKKFKAILPAVLLLLLATVRLHAQINGIDDGCPESPENPTLILGFIASAASVGYVQLRRHFSGRKKTDRK